SNAAQWFCRRRSARPARRSRRREPVARHCRPPEAGSIVSQADELQSMEEQNGWIPCWCDAPVASDRLYDGGSGGEATPPCRLLVGARLTAPPHREYRSNRPNVV